MILLPDHRPPPGPTKGGHLGVHSVLARQLVFIEWMMR